MLALKPIVTALVALLTLVAPALAQQPAANPRIALVVGEQTYRDQALATTANDAGLVAQTLQSAGFDVVGARDLDGQSLRTALKDFLDKAAAAGPDMQAFVYFSGRGVQYGGDNYLVPIDATLRRDADVPIEAIRVGDFIHALATLPGRARIVVLDAARAGPYATEGAPLAPGLALVDAEPGVLIAFNATPGTLAGDEQGPYGVYGKTLAGAIRQGGLDIAEAFDQTRVLVNEATQGALLPWNVSKLGAPYYVFDRAADAPAPSVAAAIEQHRQPMTRYAVDDAYAVALQRDSMAGYREFLAAYPHSNQARRVRAILAARREAAFWRRARDADTPRAYWTYLRAYPTGPHVADVHRRLASLNALFEAPGDFEPVEFAGLPPPQPDENFYAEAPVYAFDDFGPPPPPPPSIYMLEDDDDWRDLPPPPPPPDVGVLPYLGVAVPVIAGAVAYQGLHHWRHDGVAERGGPAFAPPPLAPPPLPAGVKPAAPPSPRPASASGAGPRGPVVRPLPPIAQAQAPGSAPGAAKPGPAPGVPGAPQAQPNPPAPLAPGQKPAEPAKLPAAQAPAAAAPARPSPSPAVGGAPTVAPGGKPLPAPLTPTGAQAPAEAKPPAPAAAPAKPAPAEFRPAPGPAPAAPNPAPAPAKPQLAPAVPAPTPPAAPQVHAPTQPAPAPASRVPVAPAPPPPAVHAPAPVAAPPKPAEPQVHAPPPAPVVHAPAPAPVVHAPPAPAPAPVVHAPPPAPTPPPVVHAPPPAPAPAPVVHAPPPAPPPPPVVHAPAPAPAPPPVVHAPPPAPPPVVHAPPPAPAPAPVMHAPPPAPAQAPAARPPGQPPGRPPAPGQPGAPSHPPGGPGQPQPQ